MQYSAPLLTRDDFEMFRSRRRGGRGKQLRWGVRNAFVLMAWFYGFDYWDGRGEVPVGERVSRRIADVLSLLFASGFLV